MDLSVPLLPVKGSNSCQNFREITRERYARTPHNLPIFLILLFGPFEQFSLSP
jgi:hypothetical protein